MGDIFNFGETVDKYTVKVFNEREIRAASGILFLISLVSFLIGYLTGNYFYLKIIVMISALDFSIRVLINPKFSPSLILGRIMVHKQVPEYVGAPQKRFAWGIGLVLGIALLFFAIIQNTINIAVIVICVICMIFLFLDTSFGICVGCNLYNMFNKEHAKLCPGGVCELHAKEEIQKTSALQVFLLFLFIVVIFGISKFLL